MTLTSSTRVKSIFLKFSDWIEEPGLNTPDIFVNPSINEIKNKLEVFDFDTIQLHGNEDQNFINEVKSNFKKKIYKSISPEDFKTTKLIDLHQII